MAYPDDYSDTFDDSGWTTAANPNASWDQWQDNPAPSGGGYWQNNDTGAWGGVPQGTNYGGGTTYTYPGQYQPASYGAPAGGGSYTDQVNQQKQDDAARLWQEMNYNQNQPTWAQPRSGAPNNAGNRAVASMTPQTISMGTPERTLYDKYKNYLMNPDQLTSDPAYKFLFNQGQSALNRSLAAKRLLYGGKALDDTTAFGEGTALNYFKQMMPQYQAGAEEELKRFMGPASLLPTYASTNNRTISNAGAEAGAQDSMAMMPQLLSGGYGGMGGGMGGGYGTPNIPTGPSFGGISSGYNYGGYGGGYPPRLQYAMGGGDTFDLNDPNLVYQN